MTCINCINEEAQNFTKSKKARDRFCISKDRITRPILYDISIKNPKDFYAMLMPCIYGEEAYIFNRRKVPNQNLFALERHGPSHSEILNCTLPDRKQLKGMSTTEVPMPAYLGMERAKYLVSPKWDVFYLDFFGQPEPNEHYHNTIKKIFELELLKEHGTMILTFGKTRCSHKAWEFNNALGDKLKVGLWVQAAAKETGYLKPKSIEEFPYISVGGSNKKLRYQTTVVQW